MKCFLNPRVLSTVKWSLVGAVALALMACGSGNDEPTAPASTTIVSSAGLSGDQELPPTITGALGTGTLSLTSPSRDISGSIVLDGIAATAAHIHLGDTGVNGAVIVPLTQTVPGTWSVPAGTTLTESQAAAFASGGLYFNAHTAANPGGEVRGQIGREVFAAQMSSAQEVPTNTSSATGNGLVSFDPTTKAFKATVTLTGLSATAAHIHTGTLGINGPVLFGLTQTTPTSGVWVSAADAVLTDAQLATLKSGGLYFNAHSAAFPGGEIRGQIARNVRFASLSAAEEVPTNASAATGSGTLVIDPATRAASGSIALTGMTATAAHIHLGAAGSNGPVIVPLSNTSGNVWAVPANTVLSADQFRAFKQGSLYYNAHSVAFPAGEIRGQIR